MERDSLDEDTRRRIARKSNDKCCHCGKTVFLHYGATVDHFIPLSKGGTNRDINLIMLCDDCNQTKNNRILAPENYLKYLPDEHFKPLNDYFESYIHSFEYIERQNILACDEYIINMYTQITSNRKIHGKRPIPKLSVSFKRVMPNDDEEFEKVYEYFVRYLKRTDHLDGEEDARNNLKFWQRFGCIYYAEMNGEIKIMMTFTLRDCNPDLFVTEQKVDKEFVITMFPYYSNDVTVSLACGILENMPYTLMGEQELTELPININILSADKSASKIFYQLSKSNKHGTLDITKYGIMDSCCMLVMNNDHPDNLKIQDDERLQKFFGKFKETVDDVDEWFEKNHIEGLEWMKTYLFENITIDYT